MNINSSGSKWIAMVGTAVLFSGMAVAQMSSPNHGTPGAAPDNAPNNPASINDRQMQDSISGQSGTPEQQVADKMFVKNALQGGMAEVQMGQLATQKASSEAVKNFGQKMVDDHTKLGGYMKMVAKKLGVAVPTKLDGKDQALYNKLQTLSGTEFDNAYVKAMVKDHKKDASEFKTEAENAADPDLKKVAARSAQVIDEHLHMIEGIAKSNNVASK